MSGMPIIIVLLITASFNALAQVDAGDQWTIEGNVIDIFSKKPVQADITFEALPFGGSIGFYQGDSVRFTIPGSTSFQLQIKADGYTTYSRVIHEDDFTEGFYSTTIELLPNKTNQLIRLEKLLFNLGKANISEESFKELDAVVHMLKENPGMVIQLEGHTDFRGNEKQNMKLSKERVKSVRAYLVSRGIKKKRIKTKAFGGAQPLYRGHDSQTRERNRRVEVRILSN